MSKYSCVYYKILEAMDEGNDEHVGLYLKDYQFSFILKYDKIYNTISDSNQEKVDIYNQLSKLLLHSCKKKKVEYIIGVLYLIDRLRYKYDDRNYILYIENLYDCMKALVNTQKYSVDKDKILNCMKLFFCYNKKYSEIKELHKASRKLTVFESKFWKSYIDRFGDDYYKNNIDISNFFQSIRRTMTHYNPNNILASMFKDLNFGDVKYVYMNQLKEDLKLLIKEDLINSFKFYSIVYPKEIYETEGLISRQKYIFFFKKYYYEEMKLIVKILKIINSRKIFDLNIKLTQAINEYLKYRKLYIEEDKDFLGYETRESLILNIISSLDQDFFLYYLKLIQEQSIINSKLGGSRKTRKKSKTRKKQRKSRKKSKSRKYSKNKLKVGRY